MTIPTLFLLHCAQNPTLNRQRVCPAPLSNDAPSDTNRYSASGVGRMDRRHLLGNSLALGGIVGMTTTRAKPAAAQPARVPLIGLAQPGASRPGRAPYGRSLFPFSAHLV
jgi:hypothetical protein